MTNGIRPSTSTQTRAASSASRTPWAMSATSDGGSGTVREASADTPARLAERSIAHAQVGLDRAAVEVPEQHAAKQQPGQARGRVPALGTGGGIAGDDEGHEAIEGHQPTDDEPENPGP